MFREDTFCVAEGQVWHPASLEVVIPGCFRGVLMGGTWQLPGPAGGVGDLSNRELVLSFLLLVVGSILWSSCRRRETGPLCTGALVQPHPQSSCCNPCLCCPHICPQLEQSLQLLQKRFPGTGLTIRQWTKSQPGPVTRLVSMC